MDLKKIFIESFKIIYMVIIIFVAYQIIRAIIGGSWETENIIVAGIGIILAGMFTIAGFLINQAKCLGRIEERTKIMGENLSRLGYDYRNHMEKYHSKT